LNAYRQILRVPHLAWLLWWSLVGRLPIGINGLAMVLFLREQTGSFTVPGAVAGGLALGIGAGAPFMGRLVDRQGTRVLVPVAVLNAVTLLGLLALGFADAPAAILIAVAVLCGAMYPPSPSVLRSRYPSLLAHEPGLVPRAYALDSVLLELTFVIAPLITAVLVAVLEPAAAIVFSAAAILVGTVAFAASLPDDGERLPGSGGGLLGALRSPGILTLVVTMLPVGFGFGAIEVALPAFSADEASPELAGVLIAVWSLGSAAGGFVYGARPRRMALAALHLRLTLLLPLAFLPILLSPSVAVMAIVLVPAGALIAPLIATRNELASTTAPVGTKTEALTWPLTALVSGIALGAATGGALIDAYDWHAAALSAVVATAIGGAVATARRHTLRRAVAAAAATA
jgi:MFS family permease